MRRRVLLGSTLLLGLAGCGRQLLPLPSTRSTPAQPVAPGDFAVLFTNMGAGEDPEQRHGTVLLVGSDGVPKGEVSFTPMDNARMITHNGAIAWLANDAAHYWGATHAAWNTMPSHGGAVDTLVAAGPHVLGVINEGTQDPGTYQSGLILFNDSDAEPWKHSGFLGSGTGWSNGTTFGFSAASLYATGVQLTVLVKDGDKETFGPIVESSNVWGERMVTIGDHAYALVVGATAMPSGELWQVDVANRIVSPMPLLGPGADVTAWYSDGGPSQLTAIDGQLYWLSGQALWAADPTTGQTRSVKSLPRDAGKSWVLTSSGLVGVSRSGRAWELQHYDAIDGELDATVGGITPEGPQDLFPAGAARIL